MDGKYIAEAGVRGYQLCEQDTVQALYHHQQIEAWGEMSIKLIHEALQKLDASAQKVKKQVIELLIFMLGLKAECCTAGFTGGPVKDDYSREFQ